MSTTDAAVRGRVAFSRRAWDEACMELRAADGAAPLGPDDLERLAEAAYLSGREADAVAAWIRAYTRFAERGDVERAARCGFWLSHNLLLTGDVGQSRGWLARAQQLLDGHGVDCAERGYLLVVEGLYAGDAARSYEINREVCDLAARFGDHDLATLGLLCRGKALIDLGRIDEGMNLLDQAIVALAAGEVTPIVTGVVYCAAILACRSAFDLGRAREWTAALSVWCDAQESLVPFRGQCMVHRSEIMQVRGDWSTAMEEAKRACSWLSESRQPALALAFYQRAELHRLRGEPEAAERAYEQASRSGFEPQPGLSLLRLGQGRVPAAAAAIRLAKAEAAHPFARSRLLGPFTEIMLAAGDLDAARAAADELSALAAELGAVALDAAAAQASGTVLLATGDPTAALTPLRRAWALWQRLEAPYEVARARAQLGRACRVLGDHDTARLHLRAAHDIFADLGAGPDAAAVDRQAGARAPGASGLTRREVQVLALVAAGRTNRAIAEHLIISEKTVERHLSNIFVKVGVSNRAAATAYAHSNGLA